MLQELLHRCSDHPDSKTDSKDSESQQKYEHEETLLKNVLDDILEICDDATKEGLKERLSRL